MMFSAFLVGGAIFFLWVLLTASHPNLEYRRRSLGKTLWGTIFIYLGLFAALAGRGKYSGSAMEVASNPLLPPVALGAALMVSVIAVAVIFVVRPQSRSGRIMLLVAVFAYLGSVQLSDLANGDTVNVNVLFVGLVVLAIYFLGESHDVVLHRIRFWLRAYLIVSFIAVIVIPEWALVPPEFGVRNWVPTRLIGVTSASNYMSLICGMLVVVEYGLRHGTLRRFFIVAAATACVWTQGRTGLLILLFGVAILYLSRRTIGATRVALGWVSAFGLLVGVGFEFLSSTLLDSQRRLALDSFTTGRLDSWGFAWNSFLKSPLFGYGSGFFGTDYWRFQSGVTSEYANGHNQLLHALGQTGIIGGVAVTIFVVVLVGISVSRAQETKGMSVGIASIIVVQLAFGTPLHITGLSWNLIVLLSCLGVVLAPRAAEVGDELIQGTGEDVDV